MAKRLFRITLTIIVFVIVTFLNIMPPEVNGMPLGVTVTPNIFTDEYDTTPRRDLFTAGGDCNCDL